jgi:hypothetical protein
MQVRVCSECKGRGYGESTNVPLLLLDLQLFLDAKAVFTRELFPILGSEMPSVFSLRDKYGGTTVAR